MRVLAFDSTGPIITVGLVRDRVALGRWDHAAERGRGDILELLIDRALTDAGWTRSDVEGLALVTGPGSLTAMRIGWATASGWAMATGIPVTGWTTPDTQYRSWKQSGTAVPSSDGQTWCVIHYRGDVFCGYEFDADRSPDRPQPIILGQWKPNHPHIRLIGPGVIGYRQRWLDTLGPEAQIIPDESAVVGGEVLALWGEDDLAAGRALPLDRSPLDYGFPPDFRKLGVQ